MAGVKGQFDELSVSTGQRIESEDLIGYKAPYPLVSDLGQGDFIALIHLAQFGIGIAPINPIDISGGSDYTYAYDGRFGTFPQVDTYTRNANNDGWQMVAPQVELLDSGDIYILGDFSSGQWLMIVRA